jgi:hypothetical protein
MMLSHKRCQITLRRLTLIPRTTGDIGMEHAAIVLAILGFAVGMVFRLKMLLLIIALVLLVSVVLSFVCDFTFPDAVLIIMVAQTILQTSYFLGLVVRVIFITTHRMRPAL